MGFLLKKLICPRLLAPLALMLGLLATASPGRQAAAQNAPATSSMQITATVLKLCAAASDLAFGDYSPTTAKDGQADLNVICTTSTPYTIALNLGSATSATSRQMAGSVLNYTLYRNTGRTEVWGETAGTDTHTGTGTGSTQTVTVFGRIPANQRPQPGLYTDTVTVTLTY